MKKIIAILGCIITAFAFWLGAGMPSFSAEDIGKILNVMLEYLK